MANKRPVTLVCLSEGWTESFESIDSATRFFMMTGLHDGTYNNIHATISKAMNGKVKNFFKKRFTVKW